MPEAPGVAVPPGAGDGPRVVASGDHTAAIVAVDPGAGVLAGGVVADCLAHVLPSVLVGHGAGATIIVSRTAISVASSLRSSRQQYAMSCSP